MAKQTVNQGTAPTGAGGDTFRSGTLKLQQNDDEIYTQLGADSTGKLPIALPITKGGTGAITAATARENLGLGSAATKTVGVENGNVAEYQKCFGGAFGVNVDKYFSASSIPSEIYQNLDTLPVGERILIAGSHFSDKPALVGGGLVYIETKSTYSRTGGKRQLMFEYITNPIVFERFARSDNVYGSWRYNLTSANTTTDANGFIKKASPIIQLFTNHIELNDEAQQQKIVFEKLGIGDYLIKGSTGFSQEGWYIEQPKDANGNVLIAVIYEQLENNDISIKTYKKKFDLETASIVADLNHPIDIPAARWIDLRLQELPQEDEVLDDTE